jgi:Protein of unknown function (DUF3168)
MTITEAICQRLLAADAVQAWVGTRVYQLKLPQQPTLPAIRVQLVAEPAAYHLRGVIDLWDALVQVDAFANEYDPAHPDPYETVGLVADAIEGALSAARFTIGPIAVTGCFRASCMPFYDPAELRLARLVQEYRLKYHHVSVPGKTRRPEAPKKEIASWRM